MHLKFIICFTYKLFPAFPLPVADTGRPRGGHGCSAAPSSTLPLPYGCLQAAAGAKQNKSMSPPPPKSNSPQPAPTALEVSSSPPPSLLPEPCEEAGAWHPDPGRGGRQLLEQPSSHLSSARDMPHPVFNLRSASKLWNSPVSHVPKVQICSSGARTQKKDVKDQIPHAFCVPNI